MQLHILTSSIDNLTSRYRMKNIFERMQCYAFPSVKPHKQFHL